MTYAEDLVSSQQMSLANIAPLTPLSDKQFRYFQNFAANQIGVKIADFKKSMVARRVGKRIKKLSVNTVESYIKYIEDPSNALERQSLINVLTTNKTSFFRESHHFHHLRSSGLPEALARTKNDPLRPLRIWSAGCSTGEEAWSIAMIAHEILGDQVNKKVRILATDINTDVIDEARRARYSAQDVASIPDDMKSKYIRSLPDSDDYAISDELRRLVSFKQINLQGSWPFKAPLDIIFCRNVTIYFDRETRRKLYSRFADVLVDGGMIYSGHSESFHGLSDGFRLVGNSMHRRAS